MASNVEETVLEENTVRRTRSGREVKPSPMTVTKPVRKTKKKTIVVEVEVSEDEDELSTNESESAQPKEIESANGDLVETIEAPDPPIISESEVKPEISEQNLTEKTVSEEIVEKIIENADEVMATPEEKVEEIVEDQIVAEVERKIQEAMEAKMDETTEEVNDKVTTKIEEVDKMETEEVSNEDIANPETEVISEDELPTVQAVKVPETEEVSDDELPGPKLAELPADTEVVSEDELPSVKKDGAAAGVKRKAEDESPAEDAKRPAIVEVEEEKEKEKMVEEDKDSKVDKTEKDKEKTGEKEKKDGKSKLPELDKYWKAVNDDPTDFTGWTYLLQYVDQVNDIEAAREAYDAFLSHYPYCYGYWRKYADYEKRKGNKKKCEEVFERGLKAIPLSVDLWLHFLNYTKTAYAESEENIREQFERALSACGLEFRSDRLWDTYIKWETEGKRLQSVTGIYDRLLATPTQGYTTHFDNFQEHVATNAPNKILSTDEFVQLRKEVRQSVKTTPAAENPDIPPGEDEIADDAALSDEEAKRIKERIISVRRKIHKTTVSAVTARWNYEEGIKRPYFHVKPLERCQLKNWKEYLDFEVQQGDQTRIIILFERCLIACALYEEFWLRYVKYLEDQKSPNTREVYERACTVHHVGKPALHLSWAIYEEAQNNLIKSSEILINLEKSLPNLLQIAYRRINLERRRGDLEKCSQLYESYIQNSKYKIISASMAIKYARFTYKICHDFEKAIEIMKSAIQKDLSNPRLYLQLVDLYLQRKQIDETEILSVLDQFLEEGSVEGVDQKVMFAQRKLEFLEDFGSDIHTVQKAFEEYQKYCRLNKDKKKKEETKSESVPVKKSRSDPQPPLPNQQSQYNYSGGNYGPNQNAYNNSQYGGQQSGYGGQYGGQYPPQGGGDQYQYQNWQYSQPGGYGGYNQWGGYGNYYQ